LPPDEDRERPNEAARYHGPGGRVD
jgi:hypothetical protein